jgi:acetyl esterase/lipase
MFTLHPRRVPSAYPPPYREEPQPPTPDSPQSPAFSPNLDLILRTAPPLDPAWLAHEATLTLPPPNPNITPKKRQENYSQCCKALNAKLLSGIYTSLNHGIKIFDTIIDNGPEPDSHQILLLVQPPSAFRGRPLPIRSYNPFSAPSGPPSLKRLGRDEEGEKEGKDIVVYYHGGGLYVGDLNSEDLTCRRICKELGCTVYSVDYRLMPDFTADDAIADAMVAFSCIANTRKARRLIVMGSSSGGQLAAMVAARYRTWKGPFRKTKIHGVCLRGPVLCDATEDGANLPPKLRDFHTSMSESFHTSLLSDAAVNAGNRMTSKMPLEEGSLGKLPRHWIQACTNDIYYSDAVLYAEHLREAGIDVKLDLLKGWPHTFWLKAPELERAVQAEKDCIEGLRWLLESEVEEDKDDVGNPGYRYPLVERDAFVPLTDEEFEKKFNDDLAWSGGN